MKTLLAIAELALCLVLEAAIVALIALICAMAILEWIVRGLLGCSEE